MRSKKRVSKKRAAKRPVRAPGPESALGNARHEQFAQMLAAGKCSQSACYAAVYGGDVNASATQTMAARLFGKAQVAARVRWLTSQAADMVVEALALTRIGLVRRLLEIFEASPLAVAQAVAKASDETNALTDEEKRLLALADGVEPGMFGWKVRLSNKVALAREIASIMGWHAEDESAKEAADAQSKQADSLGELVALARRQGSFH